jgi:integrase
MTPSKIYDDMALKAAVARCQKDETKGSFRCGPGLTCVVTEAGRARFVHRYPWAGKYESLWLDGTYPRDVTLGEARQQCEAHRTLLDQRINPKDARDSGVSANPTLAEYATANFLALATPKDRKLGPEKSEWLRDMTKTVGSLASMKIDSIETSHIATILEARWSGTTPTPTAKRLVMRLKVVLRHRHSKTRPDQRDWQNPADMDVLCDIHGRDRHHRRPHASLSFRELPAFMVELRQNELMSARVLEWAILNGVRSKEACGARWGEIDWQVRTWTIPVERLKTEQNKPDHVAKSFVVPLSWAAVQLLRRVRENRSDFGPRDFIFPSAYSGRVSGPRRAQPYKTTAPLEVAHSILPHLKKTTHGFRSSLVAWGVSVTHRDRDHFALDLMDRVIGHQIGSKEMGLALGLSAGAAPELSGAIGSYAHDAGADPYLPRRKAVMREWSAFLAGRARSPKQARAEIVKAAKALTDARQAAQIKQAA